MSPRAAAILRQLAERDAERAQLQLELAAELERAAQAPSKAPRASRAPRLVAMPPAPVVAPEVQPSEIDRARAHRELRRLGYRTGGR